MSLINKKQEYQDQEDWSNDVEKLKGYNEFKEKVEWWAKQMYIIRGSYEIVYDEKLGWCVDVDGRVNFNSCMLGVTEIPFQFRNVSGYFCCKGCKKLTSLKGCPIYIGGDFGCAGCKNLTSLEYCPKEVDGHFYCGYCGKKFKEEYVRTLCNIKGRLWVY